MKLLPRRSGSRDIWAVPPGGQPVHASRRAAAPIAFAVATTLMVAGAVGYSSMRASTAVSAQDALAEFQGSKESATKQRPRRDAQRRTRDGKERSARGGRTEPPARQTSPDVVQRDPNREAAGAGAALASTGADSENAPQRQRADTGPRPARPERPREGVFAWQVEGHEQAPGVRRDLPARSHRVITHQGAGAWQEHHIFSREREQWMNLGLHEDGVTATSVRNRVVMGPVEVDRTVVYNPPVFVARLPNQLGRTWRGSWQGKTSGTYTGRTFDHTTLVIEGEEIEVWASEVVMTMRGEVQGKAITRSWYSPKYSMVVKQYQDMDVESGPGNYSSEWTGQVLSVTPQT